jgi:V/A-type H+/Na+-transporting ATPase subunit D
MRRHGRDEPGLRAEQQVEQACDMTTIALSKSSLQQQRNRLGLFRRFLPSLELKRQQLTTEYHKALQALADATRDVEQSSRALEGLLAILGSTSMKLAGLVRLRRIELAEEHVLGVRLPVLRAAEFDVADYSLLATPFWLDALVKCIKELLIGRIRLQLLRERVARMHSAVRRVTQRVNLFEHVLIPGAKRNITHIQIFLADIERSAVVTAKIAKAKHTVERTSAAGAAGGAR